MEALSKIKLIDESPKFGDELTRPSTCDTHGDYTEKGHVFFHGKNIWSGCSACADIENEKANEERRIQRDIQEQKIIEKRLNQAGIPLRFRDRDFESFIATTKDQKNALAISVEFAENFDNHFKNGSSLMFSGKAGTGKSHLALAIAKAIMPKYTAMYLNAMDAVRMIRDTWRKGSEQSETEVLELLGSIDLLVIDEVGVQNGTDNEQVLLFDIINRRYRDMKPTIFLTNLGTSGFKEFITERSFDRLKESGNWVTFNWESYRGKK